MFLKSGNTFHPFGIRYPEKTKSPTQNLSAQIEKSEVKKGKINFI
jgi:hypothetical protein